MSHSVLHEVARPGGAVTRRRPLGPRLAPYLLLAPMLLMMLISAGYPLVRQTVMSLQKFGLAQQFGRPPEWVGLANYQAILGDPHFWQVFVRSLAFCLWTAGTTMALGVAFAVLLQRAHAVARMLFNIAMVIVWSTPAIAGLTIWLWLFDPTYGVVDWVLVRVGLSSMAGFNWFGHSVWTFYLIASAVIVWAAVPFVAITVYSALGQVSEDVTEAAELDGAGRFRALREVVFPIIAPVLFLVTILQVIWDLRVFTQIHVLQQGGGVASQTDLLGTYIFAKGVAQSDYGSASALSMIVLALTLVLTAGYLRQLYKEGGEQ